MNGLKLAKVIGFGVLVWAVLFVVAWAALAAGIFGSVWTQIGLAVIAGIAAYLFAGNAKAANLGDSLLFGATFAAVGIVLDAIFSRQLVGGLFGLWTYYLAYALVLLAPTVELGFRGETLTHVTR